MATWYLHTTARPSPQTGLEVKAGENHQMPHEESVLGNLSGQYWSATWKPALSSLRMPRPSPPLRLLLHPHTKPRGWGAPGPAEVVLGSWERLASSREQ